MGRAKPTPPPRSPASRDCASNTSPTISNDVIVFIPKDSFFLSSFVSVFSVVEQEESKKADQNSEYWAEDSEPKCGIPTGLAHGIGFCFSHFLFLLVVSHMLQPQSLQRVHREIAQADIHHLALARSKPRSQAARPNRI